MCLINYENESGTKNFTQIFPIARAAKIIFFLLIRSKAILYGLVSKCLHDDLSKATLFNYQKQSLCQFQVPQC